MRTLDNEEGNVGKNKRRKKWINSLYDDFIILHERDEEKLLWNFNFHSFDSTLSRFN